MAEAANMAGMTQDRHPHRRSVLTVTGAALASAVAPSLANAATAFAAEIAAIEARVGGCIGLAVLDTGSGRRLRYRADERFAMCSTFKLALAATVLERIDHGALKLDQWVAYGQGDLLSYAPVTRAHVAEGGMRVEGLCAAAVEVSDNTAANLLLTLVGGPAGFTAALRRHGDRVTRLDRNEVSLNTNLAGDPRDTTTPDAMVATMRKVLLGDALTPASRARLIGWLKQSTPGLGRLRAGFPATWQAGDKTGTGSNGAINDLAIAWPPARGPVLVACYMSGSTRDTDTLSAAHKQIGGLVAGAFG
jgi:beta-lactamase class A